MTAEFLYSRDAKHSSSKINARTIEVSGIELVPVIKTFATTSYKIDLLFLIKIITFSEFHNKNKVK